MTLDEVGVSLYLHVKDEPQSIGEIAKIYLGRTQTEEAGIHQSDVLPLPLPLVPEEGALNQSNSNNDGPMEEAEVLENLSLRMRSTKAWLWLIVLVLNIGYLGNRAEACSIPPTALSPAQAASITRLESSIGYFLD